MDNRKRKRWMQCDLLSKEYLDGVEEFLNFAFRNKHIGEKVACPCRKCVLSRHLDRVETYEHLVINGIMIGYDTWVCHGESISTSIPIEEIYVEQDSYRGDDLVGMLNDAFGIHRQEININMGEENLEDLHNEEFFAQSSSADGHPNVEMFDKLIKDANEELYVGCKNFSKLSYILHLYNIKCRYGWSDESFGVLIKTLKPSYPEGNKLSNSLSEVKKIIDLLGLKYEKIHACPNDCILFWKNEADKDVCSVCGTSRWKEDDGKYSTSNLNKKKNKVPAKVLRYFPIKSRLKRLYMSSKTSNLMTWHAKARREANVLKHPVDSEAWKSIDSHYPDFAKEPRNIRLGLASDGFSPFGTLQSVHSTWPVILIPYNLPPWLCMKEPYMMLSLLIPGPKAPGNDIDVYLQPLIDDLHDLWSVGVETYDASQNANFNLRAILMWTINDFPGYGNLSGWNTHSRFACPCCNVNTCSKRLKNGKKFCFMGHRRFLESTHSYRRDKKSFDGKEEFGLAPLPPSGSEILDQLRNIIFTPGKINGQISGIVENTWKKKSIFFNLPYWKNNLLRHNLDVMHIEKNVCDNVVFTLLNIDKKSKDNLNARRDLQEMNIRKELWPQQRGSGKTYLPTACFNMSSHEKKLFYEVLENVKFPDGYASNIARCVRKQRKLSGLKSHDNHVLMQQLLPVALRGLLPDKVSSILIELCSCFQGLCAKTLKVHDLDQLEAFLM